MTATMTVGEPTRIMSVVQRRNGASTMREERSAAMKTRTDISAGGVIYRQENGRVEVCLIETQERTAWQLPKGIIEPGEKP